MLAMTDAPMMAVFLMGCFILAGAAVMAAILIGTWIFRKRQK